MFFATLLLVTASVTIPTQLTTPSVIIESIEQPKAELSASQADWLAKLEACESSGSSTIRILDTNHKFSTGSYQFQDETFLSYGKKYGLIATTTLKAEPLIYSRELQTQIAHKMLLNGGEYHWTNCWKKIGKNYPK